MKKDISLLFKNKKKEADNLVSIVLPVYNEEQSLPFVIRELVECLSKQHLNYRFEITFIDDCSTDDSFNIVKSFSANTPENIRISIARLAKNSGSHVAITAGLNIVRGNFIIVMASDGQDPAETIGRLLSEWEDGNELVLASRSDNLDHNPIAKFLSKIAWKLMNWSTDVNMPDNGCDLLGMDKKVLDAFNKMDERKTTFIFRILSLGFKQKEFGYVKRARMGGKSSWTVLKKFAVMTDAITGFSNKPLKLIANLGFFFFLILVLRWLIVVFGIYILNEKPTDLTIILNTIFTALAVQVLLLGVIGDYIWRILDETRKRPMYEISEIEGRIFDNIT